MQWAGRAQSGRGTQKWAEQAFQHHSIPAPPPTPGANVPVSFTRKGGSKLVNIAATSRTRLNYSDAEFRSFLFRSDVFSSGGRLRGREGGQEGGNKGSMGNEFLLDF